MYYEFPIYACLKKHVNVIMVMGKLDNISMIGLYYSLF